MAHLSIDGGDLVLHLSRIERFGAFHGDVRVPLSAVVSACVTDKVWKELRGYRAPGTGLPGVIALCTLRSWSRGRKAGTSFRDFAAVYGRRPAVIVELTGAEFDRLVVSVSSAGLAEEIVTRLRSG